MIPDCLWLPKLTSIFFWDKATNHQKSFFTIHQPGLKHRLVHQFSNSVTACATAEVTKMKSWDSYPVTRTTSWVQWSCNRMAASWGASNRPPGWQSSRRDGWNVEPWMVPEIPWPTQVERATGARGKLMEFPFSCPPPTWLSHGCQGESLRKTTERNLADAQASRCRASVVGSTMVTLTGWTSYFCDRKCPRNQVSWTARVLHVAITRWLTKRVNFTNNGDLPPTWMVIIVDSWV